MKNKYVYMIMFWVVGIPIHMILLPMTPMFSGIVDETRFIIYVAVYIGYTVGFLRGNNWDDKCVHCGRSKNDKELY